MSEPTTETQAADESGTPRKTPAEMQAILDLMYSTLKQQSPISVLDALGLTLNLYCNVAADVQAPVEALHEAIAEVYPRMLTERTQPTMN